MILIVFTVTMIMMLMLWTGADMLAGTYMLPSPASSIQVSFNQHSDVSPSPSRLSYHNCCHIFDKLDLCAAGGLRGLGGLLRPPRAADASPAGGRCLSLPHIRWVMWREDTSIPWFLWHISWCKAATWAHICRRDSCEPGAAVYSNEEAFFWWKIIIFNCLPGLTC